MTKSTPVQTPALKISPIASQPVRATAERKKNKKGYEECFIGILRLWLVRLTATGSSSALITSQNEIFWENGQGYIRRRELAWI